MYDILTAPLPTEWEGRAIDWDFRPMLRALNAFRRSRSDEETAQIMVRAVQEFFLGPVPGQEVPEAFQSFSRFFQGPPDDEAAKAREEASSEIAGELTLDYHYDADYLLGAFQQAYGIDLTADKVHWWRFKALLHALPPETPLGQIMSYRSADTTEMDEAHRRLYEIMKERYALPPELKGVKRAETLQEHENAFFDRF